MLQAFAAAGWLQPEEARNQDGSSTRLYQLRLDQIIWKPGDGKNILPDLVKNSSYKTVTLRPNRFFQSIYHTRFDGLKELTGREHTGQLNNDQRKEREEKFREGIYSALFCSPTMELGIDIRNLNVVHMRNVLPILLTTPSGAAAPGVGDRRRWCLPTAPISRRMTATTLKTPPRWSAGWWPRRALGWTTRNC